MWSRMSRMFLLHFLGLLIFLPMTSGPMVVLGRTATIPCNRNCSKVEWLIQTKEILVCSCSEGNFTVAPEFKGRIKISEANLSQGNASLTITKTVYNDRSWYVCSCDGEKDCDQYLDVLVPFSLGVVAGDEAKLPCYGQTNKLAAESKASVRWEKDDKLVVELAHTQMKFGAGFEDRVSVNKEDYNKGDLSLTIPKVLPTDAGLYRCFMNDIRMTFLIDLIVKDRPSHWSPECFVSVVCSIFIAAGCLLWTCRRKLFKSLCPNCMPGSGQGAPGK